MASSLPRPKRSLRNEPVSPLLELGVSAPSTAGPSTRRRSIISTSPLPAVATPLPTRRARVLAPSISPSITTQRRPIVVPHAKARAPNLEIPNAGVEHKMTRHRRQTSSLSAAPSPSTPIVTSTNAHHLPVPDGAVKLQKALHSPRKTKAPEKRVLPARIRRAAGAGDGIRDLEDMIVDWLERYCEPCTTPPESLIIHLTTLPEHLVDPPTTSISAEPSQTPALPAPAQREAESERAKIEVPTWKMVKPGEDDEEEAREEVLSRSRLGPRGLLSPVKRLRTAHVGNEAMEDTSDAYYISLHKRYEVFERKQRLREKEKLQYERHKMRSRVELLRTMSIMGWTTLVSTVLARPVPMHQRAEDWERGKEKVRREGAGWLRDVLVREGQEVLERYDFLLPVEARKQKGADSRTSTPAPSSIAPTPSVSPPPILNARVAALRDNQPSSTSHKRQSSPLATTPTSARKRNTPGTGSSRKRKAEYRLDPPSSPLSEEEDEVVIPKAVKTQERAERAAARQKAQGNGITPIRIKIPARPLADRTSRHGLLVSPEKALAPAPRSIGSSISPDEIRDMREVEASVVI